jgi:hypothetical protein
MRCTLMPDTPTCLKYSPAGFSLLQLISDAVFGKVAYEPKAGRTWVEAVRSQRCEATQAVKKALEDAWAPVFTGSVKEGGGCFVDEECSGKNRCDMSGCGGESCCSGTCAAPLPPIPLGGDCEFTTYGDCEIDAYCGEDDAGGGSVKYSCKPRSENGQPCVDTTGCQDGQLCDVQGSGSCYKLSPSGGKCNPTLQASCIIFSQWCDPSTEKCVKAPDIGQPCGGPGNSCVGWGICGTNGCVARGLEGSDCDSNGVPCLGTAQCDNNKCVLQPIQVCVGDGTKPQGGGGTGGS